MKSAPVRLWWAWQGHVVHKYIGITWRALLRYLPCHGHMIIRLSTIWEPGTNSWTISIIRLDRQASTKEPFLFFRSITSGRVIESVRSHPVPSSFQTETKKKKKKKLETFHGRIHRLVCVTVSSTNLDVYNNDVNIVDFDGLIPIWLVRIVYSRVDPTYCLSPWFIHFLNFFLQLFIRALLAKISSWNCWRESHLVCTCCCTSHLVG